MHRLRFRLFSRNQVPRSQVIRKLLAPKPWKAAVLGTCALVASQISAPVRADDVFDALDGDVKSVLEPELWSGAKVQAHYTHHGDTSINNVGAGVKFGATNALNVNVGHKGSGYGVNLQADTGGMVMGKVICDSLPYMQVVSSNSTAWYVIPQQVVGWDNTLNYTTSNGARTFCFSTVLSNTGLTMLGLSGLQNFPESLSIAGVKVIHVLNVDTILSALWRKSVQAGREWLIQGTTQDYGAVAATYVSPLHEGHGGIVLTRFKYLVGPHQSIVQLGWNYTPRESPISLVNTVDTTGRLQSVVKYEVGELCELSACADLRIDGDYSLGLAVATDKSSGSPREIMA